MDEHNLDNIEDDGGFHCAMYADELISLSIANGQITQMQEAVLLWPGWSIPSAEDSSVLGSDDLDNEEDPEKDNELPSSNPHSASDDYVSTLFIIVHLRPGILHTQMLCINHIFIYPAPFTQPAPIVLMLTSQCHHHKYIVHYRLFCLTNFKSELFLPNTK